MNKIVEIGLIFLMWGWVTTPAWAQDTSNLPVASASVSLGTPQNLNLNIPDVPSVKNSCQNVTPWWWLIGGEVVGLAVIFYLTKSMTRQNQIILFSISFFGFQFIHGIIGCSCSNQNCHQYWLINLILVGVALGYCLYQQRKYESHR